MKKIALIRANDDNLIRIELEKQIDPRIGETVLLDYCITKEEFRKIKSEYLDEIKEKHRYVVTDIIWMSNSKRIHMSAE